MRRPDVVLARVKMAVSRVVLWAAMVKKAQLENMFKHIGFLTFLGGFIEIR